MLQMRLQAKKAPLMPCTLSPVLTPHTIRLAAESIIHPRLREPTRRALARVQLGQTPYAAAKAEHIALSTIYRAIARIRL